MAILNERKVVRLQHGAVQMSLGFQFTISVR